MLHATAPTIAPECEHRAFGNDPALAALDADTRIGNGQPMFPIRDHNPSERTPLITYALIAANVLVFLYQWSLSGSEMAEARFLYDWALFPVAVSNGEGMQGLFSHMFLHAGIMHLAGNMLFLWIFGDNLENEMGHLGFLIFYIAAGLAAALAQIAPDPQSQIPMVGASGAIAGVMGGYLLLFPRARIDILLIFIIFFRVFSVPAFVMLGLWFAFQLIAGVSTSAEGGGVAYFAHAGGFAAGLLFALPLWLRRGARSWWQANAGRPPHPEATYNPANIPLIRRRK
jgi:membrane associated rhomboid family serine protease